MDRKENIMILNETPVRTSRNFLINNIKLDNLEIPSKLKEFNNVEIICDNTKVEEVENNFSLVYGIGKELEENSNKLCNNSIKLNIDKKDDIRVIYKFDDENDNLINKLEINASKDCSITIEYKSNTSKKCFHNGIIKVNCINNAKVKLVVVNLLNEKSLNFDSFENQLSENTNLEYTIIDIGAEKSVSNYYSNIVGNEAKNDLKTVYLATNNQLKDINYIAELRGKKTNIDINVQGAIKEKSKKNFKGTIDFKRGCKKAIGNENEYCMILSDDSKSIALPMLLCTEEDVEGNHSTASGRVEESELFYIMTRGLEYKEAVKLIVKARFNEIIERIKEADLREEILKEIDRRLD